MKSNLKSILYSACLASSMLLSTAAVAQSSCETTKVCCNKASAKATSGCSPSECRGAKTKFGEAKVITELRQDLIALKADMEQSKQPMFDQRSYDVRGIIGASDDESIEIIVRELRVIEKAFADMLDYKAMAFKLPENKAKQVVYLSERIKSLKRLL
ncbi:hypothetical protein [Seonamhaeicola sp.]|uniref:hypothetical protein n=1 Tax=Seonamhaeicola sp. TaxID=1912245 RepID=UPI0026187072|nr:hypothetical protein [Seonamhaeicola sp.]